MVCNSERNEATCYGVVSYYRPPFITTGGGGGGGVAKSQFSYIPTSCFILEGRCFADGILYLLVRGFSRQNLKIRIS